MIGTVAARPAFSGSLFGGWAGRALDGRLSLCATGGSRQAWKAAARGSVVTVREAPAGRWVAAVPFSSGSALFGRLRLVGGTLVLSEHTVMFEPLARLGRRKAIPLTDIQRVDPDGD